MNWTDRGRIYNKKHKRKARTEPIAMNRSRMKPKTDRTRTPFFFLQNEMIDWFCCGFTSHSTQNWSFRRRSSQPISWLSTDKLKQTQRKQTCIRINRIYYNIKLTPKKLKPGLVTSYDIRPGNGEGLFWFRRFITLSLTYLTRHLPTYLQPRDPHGAEWNMRNFPAVSVFWFCFEESPNSVDKMVHTGL